MNTFTYRKAQSQDDALKGAAQARFIGGGTTLIDLMKLDVEKPAALIDVSRIPNLKIERSSGGGLLIGAEVKNSDLAHNDIVKKDYAVLSEALLAGASAQLRNKATTAGNLLQRTRCLYFRDVTKPCNKREPGSGCAAIEGHNRNLAILGASPKCIANNPSDMNVAMMALEAKILTIGAGEGGGASGGAREIPVNDFYLLPGDTPEKETVLKPGELITGVKLEAPFKGSRSLYLKLRDRASYEFALASAAVVATVRSGKIEHVRLALGGVGAKPWRALEAEKLLEGADVSTANFAKAADAVLASAKPQSQNGFKVELARRCIIEALTRVTKA